MIVVAIAIIIALIATGALIVDAHLVTKRRENHRPPLSPGEEHDLLFTSPRQWAQRAIDRMTKGD